VTGYMKLDVWVTIGRPGESIFLETRSVTVDVPTDGKDDMRAVVFELPLGARLDGRGPIRVMLEPRHEPKAEPPVVDPDELPF